MKPKQGPSSFCSWLLSPVLPYLRKGALLFILPPKWAGWDSITTAIIHAQRQVQRDEGTHTRFHSSKETAHTGSSTSGSVLMAVLCLPQRALTLTPRKRDSWLCLWTQAPIPSSVNAHTLPHQSMTRPWLTRSIWAAPCTWPCAGRCGAREERSNSKAQCLPQRAHIAVERRFIHRCRAKEHKVGVSRCYEAWLVLPAPDFQVSLDLLPEQVEPVFSFASQV